METDDVRVVAINGKGVLSEYAGDADQECDLGAVPVSCSTSLDSMFFCLEQRVAMLQEWSVGACGTRSHVYERCCSKEWHGGGLVRSRYSAYRDTVQTISQRAMLPARENLQLEALMTT